MAQCQVTPSVLDKMLFKTRFLTADGPAFAKAMAWQAQMDADTDRNLIVPGFMASF